jgi:uncharacterized protein
MVAWNHYAHYEYAYAREHLILKSTIDGQSTFRPPIGPHDPHLLRETVALAVEEGSESPLIILDSRSKGWLSQQMPGVPLHPERDYFEYVYDSINLAELPGRGYQKIRTQLNRFRRSCNYSVECISGGTVEEVKEFLTKWCDWRDCESSPVLANEKDAILYAISHFGELGIWGCAIRVDGIIAAMALYERLNADTAVVHFEKGLPDCEGIYKAINAETAKVLANRYAFINRESDLGEPGLREAKMRYHPHHMVEVSSARREDLVQWLE